MTEGELRTLVRDAIARHAAVAAARNVPMAEAGGVRVHSSHAMFRLPDGASTDGPCVIEPGVACNHCGYCKSFGH